MQEVGEVSGMVAAPSRGVLDSAFRKGMAPPCSCLGDSNTTRRNN
jgi:hypothetical protein